MAFTEITEGKLQVNGHGEEERSQTQVAENHQVNGHDEERPDTETEEALEMINHEDEKTLQEEIELGKPHVKRHDKEKVLQTKDDVVIDMNSHKEEERVHAENEKACEVTSHHKQERVQSEVVSDVRTQEIDTYTKDGSVDRKGNPAMKEKTGRWWVGLIVLANLSLSTFALAAVQTNLVIFMTGVMRMDNADAAKFTCYWTGAWYLSSLCGAFLSDSYWGRYKTSIVFQIVFISGLVELSAASYLLLGKSCVFGDGTVICETPSAKLSAFFYIAIYQTALGAGAYQSPATTFGADQFDENDEKEKKSRDTFFSYFYLASNIATIFSNTYLAYLENEGHWVTAFVISTGTAFLALIIFMCGILRFRHFKPGGNPLCRLSQVITAAIKKRKVIVPKHGKELYEVDGKQNAINGGRKLLHSPGLKFLDKAAVIRNNEHPELNPPNPWRLCTVTQVEEVKCILRLLPIWFTCIIYAVMFTQMNSVFIEQGDSMNTSILRFHIPAASMNIFEIFGVTIFIYLNNKFIQNVSYKRMSGKTKKITELEKMGIGIFLAGLSMLVAGVLESARLKYAINCDGCGVSSSVSILWQIPQYILIGASEVFNCITQMEFFSDQAPDGLKSFGNALFMSALALGNFISSWMEEVISRITTKGGQAGWLPDNLNKGRLDRFYYFLAAISVADFILYVACAKKYRYVLMDDNSPKEMVDLLKK